MIVMLNADQVKKDYQNLKPFYEKFQTEVCGFLLTVKEKHAASVDVSSILERQDGIKKLESIEDNIREKPEKYQDLNELSQINDVAGVRITCHCQSDREVLFNILGGEILQQQEYIDVDGQEKDGIYRAYHYNFSKIFDTPIGRKKLSCEVQLRTVLGDAWAKQDTKYVYKKISEGEPHVLSKAISDILNSCEALWDLVKEKTRTDSGDSKRPQAEIIKLSEKIKMVGDQIKIKEKDSNLTEWLKHHQLVAKKGLTDAEVITFMEVEILLPLSELNLAKTKLNDVAREAPIRTFGWPIALYLERDEYRPKVLKDGIVAEIKTNDRDLNGKHRAWTYDYWTIRTDGSFYLAKSLFENTRKPTHIFFDTRIIRTTEVLMYALNLYSALGVPEDQRLTVKIRYSGINGKKLGAAGNRLIHDYRICHENDIEMEITASMKELSEEMSVCVGKLTAPLFELFDFFAVSQEVLYGIVNNYRKGIIT